MPYRDAIAGSQVQVEAWARGLAPLVGAPPFAMRIPRLSTAHFDCYVVGQPAIGPAGDLGVMCDGQTVLAGSAAHFSTLLRREGFGDNPAALPPAQFGNLFLIMVIAQRIRVIEAPDDFALGKLRPAARAAFQRPQSRREPGAVIVSFWTSGPEPFDVRVWEVRVARDASLAHTARPAQ